MTLHYSHIGLDCPPVQPRPRQNKPTVTWPSHFGSACGAICIVLPPAALPGSREAAARRRSPPVRFKYDIVGFSLSRGVFTAYRIAAPEAAPSDQLILGFQRQVVPFKKGNDQSQPAYGCLRRNAFINAYKYAFLANEFLGIHSYTYKYFVVGQSLKDDGINVIFVDLACSPSGLRTHCLAPYFESFELRWF